MAQKDQPGMIHPLFAILSLCVGAFEKQGADEGMSTAGIVLMGTTFLLVTLLTIYCFVKVLKPDKNKKSGKDETTQTLD